MSDRTVRVILQANIQQYQAAMQQATQSTTAFGRELTAGSAKSNDALRSVGHGATIAGAGLVAGFAVAAGAAMNFDRQMSAVGAATMATAGELNSLRDAALDAGQATAFSATESAAAIENLAKAGISTADILGGALAGSLSLAAAGGLDVAQAAEIAATALTQFGLSGGDVEHVADLLAAGAGKAQGDVTDLGMALKQSGLVAAQTGLSIEETTAALAAFASAGLLGSDAGTSLKSMLQRLTPTSTEASERMAELGFSAFDAQGNFIGLTALAGEMQSSFGGLTVEQRNLAMATIFGSDAVRAAGVLFSQGAEGIADWQTEVNDAGYAAEQARIRMDNLAGDLEQLGGAIETALIKGGSTATGALRFLTQGATSAVNAVSDMPPALQLAGMATAGLGGVALLAAGTIATIAVRAREAQVALKLMGPAGEAATKWMNGLGRFAGMAGKLTGTASALFLVGQALDSIFPLDTADIPKLENALLDLGSTGRVAGELADAMGDDFGKLADAVERVGAPSVATQARHTLNELSSLGGLLGRGDGQIDQARQRIDDLDKALADLARRNPQAAAEALQGITDGLEAQGIPAERVTGLLDDYDSTLADLDTQQRTTGAAAGELADDMGPVEQAFDDATKAAEEYRDTLRSAFDPLFGMVDAITGVRDAQIGYQDALIGVDEAQHALDDAIREHGATSTEAYTATRDLEGAHRDLDDAMVGTATSAFNLTDAARELAISIANGGTNPADAQSMLAEWARQGLLTTEQAWFMAAAFQAAADEANGVVPEVAPAFEVDTAPAVTAMANLESIINGLPADVPVGANTAEAIDDVDSIVGFVTGSTAQMTVTANTNPALTAIKNAIRVASNAVASISIFGSGHAAGGLIGGSGSGDIVPAMLEPGEFVMRKSAVQAIGVGHLAAMNQRGGIFRAVGGPVGAAHLAIAHQSTMLGNLSGTTVGRNITADHKDDPAGARQDLLKLLDLYNELVDTLGQAVADELVFASTGLDGFQTLADGALGFADSLKEIAAEQARVAAEHERIHDVMFAVGDLSTDDYLAMLNGRLAATEKYSDDWYDIWQQINRITEDAAEEEQAALDKAREERERALEQEVSDLTAVYQRAQQRFEQAGADYADAIAERSQRILDETNQFRTDIVATFRSLANPVDIFGGADDVTAAGVEAALRHRVDAAGKFASTFAALSARGIDQSVLTQLAQGGPDNLSLANALLEVDPALVNEAMASTAAIGGSVADLALGWEGARIQQQVYADVALPAQQSFNDLLDEELRLRDEQMAQQTAAEAWARRMATDTMPQLADAVGDVADEAERYLRALSQAVPASGVGAGGTSTTWSPVFHITSAPASEGGMTRDALEAKLDEWAREIAGAVGRGVR